MYLISFPSPPCLLIIYNSPICVWSVFQFFSYWSIIALQCCISVCCTKKWISHMYTYILSLWDLTSTPHLPPPSHSSGSSQSTKWASCVLQKVLTSYLFYTWWCIYVNLSLPILPTLPSPHVHMPILCISVSIPALKIGSSICFSSFHTYALIYDICFSLSYFPLYDRLLIHPNLLISTPHCGAAELFDVFWLVDI